MQKYDVACIGAGIASLTTAALLSKRGKAVCLLDPADGAGGCVSAVEIGDFRFTAGPAITYGFEPGGALHKLCVDLDLSTGATTSFPGYQVVMRDHRITISGDPRETLDELIREFPAGRQGLTRLYSDVLNRAERGSKSKLASWLLRNRTAAAYLRSFRLANDLTAFFDVQTRYFFGTSLQHVPLSLFVRMLSTAPHFLPGGFTRLADQLISIVQQHNGEWFHREPFPELQFRNSRISCIKTSRGLIEPRSVILNVPGDQHETTRFFGIRNDVVPVGMLSNVLCLDDEMKSEDYYSLSVSSNEDKMAAPGGMRSLTAVFPHENVTSGTTASLLDKIAMVVPFFRENLVSSAELDHQTRWFELSASARVRSTEYRPGRAMLTSSAVNNLRIIPDSVRLMVPAVFTAQIVAGKLK